MINSMTYWPFVALTFIPLVLPHVAWMAYTRGAISYKIAKYFTYACNTLVFVCLGTGILVLWIYLSREGIL